MYKYFFKFFYIHKYLYIYVVILIILKYRKVFDIRLVLLKKFLNIINIIYK